MLHSILTVLFLSSMLLSSTVGEHKDSEKEVCNIDVEGNRVCFHSFSVLLLSSVHFFNSVLRYSCVAIL